MLNNVITYSKYQTDIFDAVTHGVGNIVIEACAGSGKTSTLLKIFDLLPKDKKILFSAFNKDIVKEINSRVTTKTNTDIKTVHGIGLLMIRRNIKSNVEICPNKYKEYIINNVFEYSTINSKNLSKTYYERYINNISTLVEQCRYRLIDDEKSMGEIIEMHGLHLIGDESKVALKILNWGKNNTSKIDYTDMVWLPNVLYMKPFGLQYDYVLCDEAQDLSIAQRELILKCRKMGTRYIFCGDKHQCIYSFASASPDSFDFIKSLPNTTTYPLSISYRCSKNVVKLAKTIVPNIEWCDGNIDGEINYNANFGMISDCDMVICRMNAPLTEIYCRLKEIGKKCHIQGKDIGVNLKRMVELTNTENLNIELETDGVFSRLYKDVFGEIHKLFGENMLDISTILNDTQISNYIDNIQALEILSQNIKCSADLIKKIDSIFSDDMNDGIKLSTIHKSKGLEANNVYIVNTHMGNKPSRKKWELEQEENLTYVAYTRAKQNLYFINQQTSLNVFNNKRLKSIENSLIKIYGTRYYETQTTDNVTKASTVNQNNNLYVNINSKEQKIKKLTQLLKK